jgi:hypothetical protein
MRRVKFGIDCFSFVSQTILFHFGREQRKTFGDASPASFLLKRAALHAILHNAQSGQTMRQKIRAHALQRGNRTVRHTLDRGRKGISTMSDVRSIEITNRGYIVHYHPGLNNMCPGCGHSHWYVGRLSAECALCAVALPIAPMRHHSPAPEFDIRAA